MRKTSVVLAVVLMLVVAVPGLAGEKHGKCAGSTQDCLDKMATKLQNKAWLGVNYELTADGHWQITEVVEESPAAKAGFQTGDVLVAINGVVYAKDNMDEVKKAWSKVAPGSRVSYVVKRSGGKVKLEATLATMPPQMIAEVVGQHMVADHAQVQVASN